MKLQIIVWRRAILERHGFTFKISFGQNFLTDTNILRRLWMLAEIDKGQCH